MQRRPFEGYLYDIKFLPGLENVSSVMNIGEIISQ